MRTTRVVVASLDLEEVEHALDLTCIALAEYLDLTAKPRCFLGMWGESSIPVCTRRL